MGSEEIKNIVVEFYSVTGILIVILIGAFVKIIYPIMDKKNTQKISVLNEKVENIEKNFNNDIGDLKEDVKSLINKLDEYIGLINKSNLKQIQDNSEKSVTFENHEQRIINLENQIKYLKNEKG